MTSLKWGLTRYLSRLEEDQTREEILAKKKQIKNAGNLFESAKVRKATWTWDRKSWHGTWFSVGGDHSRRDDHAGRSLSALTKQKKIPRIWLTPETSILIYQCWFTCLVEGYDHNKKAGARNALIWASAMMSNGSFILNLDCDHYIYISLALSVTLNSWKGLRGLTQLTGMLIITRRYSMSVWEL